jgi:molybdate transport system substrate-binding protein
MRAANVYRAAEPKLVLGENVAQALQFVQSGSAEVGIVALSLALSPNVRSAGRYWLVPADLHPRLEQGGAVIRGGGIEQAKAFRSFLLQDAARDVLKRFGFTPPAESGGAA